MNNFFSSYPTYDTYEIFANILLNSSWSEDIDVNGQRPACKAGRWTLIHINL